MATVVTCVCGKRYSVQPTLAGRKVRCPQCGAEILVPAGQGHLTGPVQGSGGIKPPPGPPGKPGQLAQGGIRSAVSGPGVAGPSKRDPLDDLLAADLGGLPGTSSAPFAQAVDPLAPLQPAQLSGRGAAAHRPAASATMWIVLGCCGAGGLVLLMIAVLVFASLGSKRPLPPPVAGGIPPQGAAAPALPAQPPQPQLSPKPVWQPDPQLVAKLGNEVAFRGLAIRLLPGMFPMPNLPKVLPHPQSEAQGYVGLSPEQRQECVVLLLYTPPMMAGGVVRLSALEREVYDAFVYGSQAKNFQSEIGLVGDAEVVRFRFLGTLDGKELWHQGISLPHADGAVIILTATLGPPDSEAYNLLGASLLTLRRE